MEIIFQCGHKYHSIFDDKPDEIADVPHDNISTSEHNTFTLTQTSKYSNSSIQTPWFNEQHAQTNKYITQTTMDNMTIVS